MASSPETAEVVELEPEPETSGQEKSGAEILTEKSSPSTLIESTKKSTEKSESVKKSISFGENSASPSKPEVSRGQCYETF